MRGGAIPLLLHPQRQFDHLLVVRYLGQPCKVQAPSKRDPYRTICGARAVSPGAHCRTAPLRSGRPKAMTAKVIRDRVEPAASPAMSAVPRKRK
jgi:hypothetical protein